MPMNFDTQSCKPYGIDVGTAIYSDILHSLSLLLLSSW
jgi:hypothetical protein